MKTETNAHPAALIPALLAAVWLLTQITATAQINVTGPGARTGLPVITSYAPPHAPVGEEVFANLQRDSFATQPDSIEFPRQGGGIVSARLIRVHDRLIKFTVPSGAITGQPSLVNGTKKRGDQPKFSVSAFGLRASGITFINNTQYVVASVKRGSTALLKNNAIINFGDAVFVSTVLSTRPTALDLGLAQLLGNAQTVPMFQLREEVMLPPSRSAVTAVRRVVVTLERLTVAEALGAVTESVEWTINQRGRNRKMRVFPNGNVTLEDRVAGEPRPFVSSFQIEQVSFRGNSSHLRFALRNSNGRVGDVITLHAPFDAFAVNNLGFFRLQDEVEVLIAGEPRDAHSLAPSPMLVRRVR